MNSYFSSVFTVEDHENFPDLEYITDEKLCNIFCSATEVEKLLRNLNIYKSPGPDYISPRILRECAQVLSSPLALFLNTSFSQGQLPSIWKSAHITPVHKKGSKNLKNLFIGKIPKMGISVGVKAKTRRNELWRPLPPTELANFGETKRVFISDPVLQDSSGNR